MIPPGSMAERVSPNLVRARSVVPPTSRLRNLAWIDRPADLLEAGDHAVHAREGGGSGTLGIERDQGRVGAVVLGLEGFAHGAPGDRSGQRVVGAHEGHLARLLDDIDGDRRQVAVAGADLGRAVLVELEVQDGLDLLDLEVLGTGERLGRIDLRVADHELDPGLLGLVLDAVADDRDERDRLAQRDVADLEVGRGRGRRGGGLAGRRLGGGG